MHERRKISTVLSDSTIASLGIIRPERLQAAIDQASRGEKQSVVALLAALSLQTWLFVRSNRWVTTNEAAIVGPVIVHSRKAQTA
jgi:hypothetical protein